MFAHEFYPEIGCAKGSFTLTKCARFSEDEWNSDRESVGMQSWCPRLLGMGVSPGVIPDEGQCPSSESAVDPGSRPRCAPLGLTAGLMAQPPGDQTLAAGQGKHWAQQGVQGPLGLVLLVLYLFCLLWDLMNVEMVDVGNSVPLI